MFEIGIINVRFYLLEKPYLHGYCRITLNLNSKPINYAVGPTIHVR
jgi:hypothetical protein